MHTRVTLKGWRIVFVLLFLSLWNLCNAEANNKCAYSAIYENDRALISDENYTAGLLAVRHCIGSNDRHLWMKGLFLFGNKNYEYAGHSHYLGFSIYTPDILERKEPIRGDGRPYSALMIYGSSRILLQKSKKSAIKQEFQLAALGLDWGGRIQRWVHKDITGSTIPQGWSSQISDGGEPSFLYSLQRRMEIIRNNDVKDVSKDVLDVDLSGSLGGNIGYYNSLQAGLAVRFGKITTPFWSDYGPSFIHAAGSSSIVQDFTGKTRLQNLEMYVFFSTKLDYVFYNALLQGQFRENDYEIPSSDVINLIPYGSMGIVVGCQVAGRLGLHASVSYNYKGQEIKGDARHGWSSFLVGVSY